MRTKETIILHDHNSDGLDRRGFLECMAWAGTGMLWTISGGLLGSTLLASRANAAEMAKGSFSFVQIMFHTTMSTAFPQPEPGKAPKPGPMKVEAGKLREYLGITHVNYIETNHSLAVVDSTLG